PVLVLQVGEDSRGLGASVPREASTLVDVVIGGDDLTVGCDQACRHVGLPPQAVGRVLEVVSRGTGTECEPDHAASPFWWSRKERTMRANTAATSGVICGASSITNCTGSRPDAGDGSVSMVPRGPSRGGGPVVALSDDLVISLRDPEARTPSGPGVRRPTHPSTPSPWATWSLRSGL